MAVVDLHANLLQSLETALDTTKIFSVFTTLMGIIKEQQEQIDTFGKRIDGLFDTTDGVESNGGAFVVVDGVVQPRNVAAPSAAMPPDLEKRLEAIESKIDEMAIALHGMGNEDPSILQAKEMTGYLAFETSAMGMANSASFDMGEISGSLVENPEQYEPTDAIPPPGESEGEEGLESRAKTPEAAAPATQPAPAPVQPEAKPEPQPLPAPAPEPPQLVRLKTPDERNPTPEVPARTKTPTPPITPKPATPQQEDSHKDTVEEGSKGGQPQVLVIEHEEGPVPEEVEKKEEEESEQAPVNMQPGWFRAPPKTPPKTPPAPAGLLAEPSELPLQELARIKSPPGESRPPSSAKVSFALPEDHDADAAASTMVVPIVHNRAGKYGPRIPNRRSSTGAFAQLDVISPAGNGPIQVKVDLKHRPSTSRRKMTLTNLPFLTNHRRERIIKELKRRGKFILVSRSMLEDARRRYGKRSLKQKVEYLEAEMQRVSSQLNVLQSNVKKNTKAIKETKATADEKEGAVAGAFPPHLEIFFQIVDELGGMDKLSSTLHTMRDLSEDSLFTPEGVERLRSTINGDMVQHVDGKLNEEVGKLRHELSGKMTTKGEMDTMLAMPDVGVATGANKPFPFAPKSSSLLPKNNDPNHVKLVALLNASLATVHERIDVLERELQQLREERQAELEARGGMDGGGGSGGLGAAGDVIELRANQYTDEKVSQGVRYMEQKVADVESKFSHTADDVVVLGLKMNAVSTKLKESRGDGESEALKREVLAVRDLQKKVASLPIDKLMEEMKLMQKDLNKRAMSRDVTEKIAQSEDGLRSLLGENVVGLRSLLYEVFRHIQSKADREDIRTLIAAKLSAMEKEMVKREEELLAVASTARCMSCGQKTVDRSASGSAGGAGATLRSAPKSPGETSPSLVLDDDISEPTPMAPYSAIHQEGVYSLLTGQGGLKPLHLQHNPLPPVQNPYPSHSDMRASTSSGTRSKKDRGPVTPVPDLAYRKARLSQHVKEMVKVSASSLQTHGFDLNANPMYVLEGQDVAGSRGGLVSTDPGFEPPLMNPFNDLAQPLSFSSLPKSANGATAATMMNSRSATNVAATRAPRTAGNVLSSSVGGEGLQIASAKLHNGYT